MRLTSRDPFQLKQLYDSAILQSYEKQMHARNHLQLPFIEEVPYNKSTKIRQWDSIIEIGS